LGFAVAVLHLTPQDFWRMTPREFAAASRFVSGSAAPNRTALSQLMDRYPDKEKAT
jgi:uncharacterized phage protein (TIGR02216 family)